MSTQLILKQHIKGFGSELLANLASLQNYYYEHIVDEKKQHVHNIYPYAEQISHPLNFRYLHSVSEFGELMKYPILLSQDGFAGMLKFFYTFSKPGKVDLVLLVHSGFDGLIPKSWRNNCLSYRITYREELGLKTKERVKDPESIYLFAQMYESEVTEDRLENELNFIKTQYPNSLDKVKLVFMLRTDPYTAYRKEVVHPVFHLSGIVNKVLGSGVTYLTFDQLRKQKDLASSVFHYITNDYYAYSFNYLEHFFLMNNCYPLSKRYFQKVENPVSEVKLSPFHQVSVGPIRESNKALWDEVSDFEELVGIGRGIFTDDFQGLSWDLYQKHFTLA